jgi:uncharacterized protein YodC (DUF2158 family)
MKWIQTYRGDLINVNQIISIDTRITECGQFSITINLIDNSHWIIGDYQDEDFRDNELRKLKEFLTNDVKDFYYYIKKDDNDMEEVKIGIGDVVLLKSGGPLMTVYYSPDNEYFDCKWFDEYRLHEGKFHKNQLRKER